MSGVNIADLVVTRGEFPAIAKGNIEIPERCFVLVTGDNGSGKSTLLKAISGIAPVQRGEIILEFNNINTNSSNPRAMRRISSYVGHSTLYVRHISVDEHLKLTSKLDQQQGVSKAEFQLSIEDAIEKFDLSSKLKVQVDHLSAGQQRRLHLASNLIRSTPLLCVDEPHSSLDEKSKLNFDKIIEEQFQNGRSLIIATHEPQRLKKLATHEVKIVHGTFNIEKIAP